MENIIKWLRQGNLGNSITTKLFSKCEKKITFDINKKLIKIILIYEGKHINNLDEQLDIEIKWLTEMILRYHFGDGIELIKTHRQGTYSTDPKCPLTFKVALLYDVSNMVENKNLEEGVKDNMALAKVTKNLRPDLRADELQKLVIELKGIISKFRKEP